MKTVSSAQRRTTLVLIVSVILHATHVSAATASMIDVAGISSQGYDHDVSGFLNYRNIDNSPILQKATVIFQNKLSDSTPLQDAALELLKICKSAEGLSTPTNSADAIKDAAKSTYAIRAALISLASASIRGPASCNSFGVQSDRFTFLRAVNGNKDASPPSFDQRTRCVGELWKTDNSWTSYTNALQDANTLCQVPSLENAQRAILDLLSDMNDIIPAWMDSFDQSHRAHFDFMREQKAKANDLDQLQRRQREDMEDNHEAAKSAMSTMMAATKSHVAMMTNTLREELVTAGLELEQMKEAVDHYIFDFLVLKDDQARIFHTYQSTFTDAVAVQSRGMHEIESTVQNVVTSLNHIYGGLEEQVRSISDYLGVEMREIFQLQGQMKEGQSNLLGQQLETIQQQLEISAFATQLKDEIADITTAVSSVNGVLGAFVTVWTGGLSALGRAIAAMLISSSLLAVIGYRCASVVCGCTGLLVWLLSPALHTIADCFRRMTGFLSAQVATLGRELFVLTVRTLSALVTCLPVYVRHNVPYVSLKYSTLALVLIAAGCAIFYSRSKLQKDRIEEGNLFAKQGTKNSGHRLLATRLMELKPDIEIQSSIPDRFDRAATLPPQRKPRWGSLHESYV